MLSIALIPYSKARTFGSTSVKPHIGACLYKTLSAQHATFALSNACTLTMTAQLLLSSPAFSGFIRDLLVSS
ncbi:hypothetical protein W04_3703 [Pseudoalteromonas sp. SW0106-04]|nr:hypothetical protein W04_3703 [Pseudoalteromonas sp. SW0106-04]